MLNVANISGTVQLTDGSYYSLDSINGKMKVFFFMDPEDCKVDWVKQFFARSDLRSASCEALLIDIYDSYHLYSENDLSPQMMMQAIMNYVQYPGAYKFSSDCQNGLMYRNQYAQLAGYPSGCASSIAVIDASNRLRYFGYIDEALAKMDKVFSEIGYTSGYGNMPAIQASQTRNDQVKLSWTPYSGANGYRVYRKIGAGEYCCVTTTAGTSFSDEVSSVGAYVYQIKALNGSKEIAASPEKAVSVKTMLLKKGKTYKVGNYKYKVLQSTKKTKTVAFAGVTNKKLTKILIADKVKINGLTYKVTEISAKALKGNKKVKTVSIGANVTKIGKQAFYKAGKLANIVVKTKIKSFSVYR